MDIDLIILAAGDLGREIHFSAQAIHESDGDISIKTIAFVDDDEEKVGTTLEGIPVISFNNLQQYVSDKTQFICASGIPNDRKKLNNSLRKNIDKPSYATLIHPSVVVFPGVSIASGSFIAANTTLATGCSIGHHAVINQNVSVGHDCMLNDYTIISPGCILSGRTIVGSRTFLGSNVVTYPGVSIGKECVVAALSVLGRSVGPKKKIMSKPNLFIMDAEG